MISDTWEGGREIYSTLHETMHQEISWEMFGHIWNVFPNYFADQMLELQLISGSFK